MQPFTFDEASKLAFARVIPPRAKVYAPVVLRVAYEQSISPYIIAAIMERESLSGEALKPKGPGGTGDGGHGRGLMQIDDRTWTSWLATHDWTDPYTCVLKGVQILKDNLIFFSRAGVHPPVVVREGYAARCGVPVGTYADVRPLTGTAQWQAAIAAYNTGAGNVLKALAAGLSADTTTAHANYSTDVLSRARIWEQAAMMV